MNELYVCELCQKAVKKNHLRAATMSYVRILISNTGPGAEQVLITVGQIKRMKC